MQFLVAIRSTNYSAPTLEIARIMAEGVDADLSVLYVGDRPNQLLGEGISLARDAMLNWQIHHPGVEVLRWAYQSMQESKFIDPEHSGFDPTNLIEDSQRIRVVVPQMGENKVRLILREGDPVDQLKDETDYRDYLLTIVGGGSRKKLTRQLVQFVDTSLMFAKNYNPETKYKILLCVDDSGATRRAVAFAARMANFLQVPIRAITVSKIKNIGSGYRSAATWAMRYLEKTSVAYEHEFIVGNPVSVFTEHAAEDHIIVMGKSRKSPIAKFFRSSKPAETVLSAQAPVVLVK